MITLESLRNQNRFLEIELIRHDPELIRIVAFWESFKGLLQTEEIPAEVETIEKLWAGLEIDYDELQRLLDLEHGAVKTRVKLLKDCGIILPNGLINLVVKNWISVRSAADLDVAYLFKPKEKETGGEE